MIRLLSISLLFLPSSQVFATRFFANLTADQVVANDSTTTGIGMAIFELNDDQTELSYSMVFSGLDLEPDPANRVNANDIDKIHLHFAPRGVPGPHVLNIFGLPSEDDADLVVDFPNNSLVGIWSDADAIDPDTGNPFDQTVGGTTKFQSEFVDALFDGDIYLAAHTIGEGGAVAVRGQVEVVPEPGTAVVFAGLFGIGIVAFRKGRANR